MTVIHKLRVFISKERTVSRPADCGHLSSHLWYILGHNKKLYMNNGRKTNIFHTDQKSWHAK